MLRPALPAALLSAVATAGVLLLTGAPAAAHITVNADKAVQGTYARAAVRVPNESPTAQTVKVELNLPAEQPVASVSTQPVPGWTVAVTKAAPATPAEAHGSPVKEVVTKITWTAAVGAGVKAGEFQEFPVSMGPLPKVDQLVFKALQTYSDGNVVRWIEVPEAGAEEPEKPAPVLKLAADEEAIAPAASTEAAEAGSSAALPVGIVGLVLGVLGAVLGGLAFARTRRS